MPASLVSKNLPELYRNEKLNLRYSQFLPEGIERKLTSFLNLYISLPDLCTHIKIPDNILKSPEYHINDIYYVTHAHFNLFKVLELYKLCGPKALQFEIFGSFREIIYWDPKYSKLRHVRYLVLSLHEEGDS